MCPVCITETKINIFSNEPEPTKKPEITPLGIGERKAYRTSETRVLTTYTIFSTAQGGDVNKRCEGQSGDGDTTHLFANNNDRTNFYVSYLDEKVDIRRKRVLIEAISISDYESLVRVMKEGNAVGEGKKQLLLDKQG